MAKLFDVDGNEVEAYTQEELRVKQEEAVAEHIKNNPNKSAEIEKLRSDLDAANKKIKESEEGGGASDQQKARLKAAKDEAEAALKSTIEKFSSEVNALKETITSGTKSKIMKALSKGDKDLEAKLDLKYKSLMKTGDYGNDEEGVTKALTEAATIVMGATPAPGFLDNMTSAGERGSAQKIGTTKAETENGKAMRDAFGISDKDAEKYSNVDATK